MAIGYNELYDGSIVFCALWFPVTCDIRRALSNVHTDSDVKRGQNLEAEAKASRPRPELRGRGQDCEVEAEAEAENK